MTDAAYKDDQQTGTFGGTQRQQSPQQGQQSPQPGQAPGPQGGPSQQADSSFDISSSLPLMSLPQQMQPRGMMADFQRHGLQQFIPAMGNRPHNLWGRPRDFPMVPKHWEIPGIMRGIGQQMAQYGSAYTGALGGALSQHTGAWMKGYMQGQEARTRLIAEQARTVALQLEVQQAKELDAYGRIFAEYGDDPKQSAALEHALTVQAATFNDKTMQTALATDHVAGAHRILSWLDAKHSDLRVANKAHQHEEEVKAAEAPYKTAPHQTDATGLPRTEATEPPPPTGTPTSVLAPPDQTAPLPFEDQGTSSAAPAASSSDTGDSTSGGTPPASDTGDGTGGTGDDSGTGPQSQATPDSSQQPRVQLAQNDEVTSDAPQPGFQRLAQAQPQQQQPQAQQQQQPPTPRQLADTPALSAATQAGFDKTDIDNLAQMMLLGQFKMSDYKNQDNRVRLAQQRAQELRAEVGNITSDPKLDTAEKVYAAIDQKLGRTMGDDVRSMVAGLSGIPRGTTAGKPPYDSILALAHKADPGLDSQTVMTRARARNYFKAGAGLQQKVKLGTAYTHGEALLKKLQDQPQWSEAWRRLLGGIGPFGVPNALRDRLTPETSAYISEMERDIQTFTSETQSVLAYGPGTKGERESLKADIDWSQPNAAIAGVKELMDRLRDRDNELRIEYEKNTGMKDWNADVPDPSNSNAGGGGKGGVVDYRDYFGGR